AVPLKSPSGVPAPPLSPETAAILEQTPAVPPPDASTKAPSISAEAEPCPGVATIAGTQAGDRTPPIESKTGLESPMGYAWQPKDPSALERALQAVSGWPAVVVPFLVQNIGWFIGGLCVVAGSVFLVSYTTGFAKALTVSLTLCAYTLFILWGGYQLRRRRPELKTSGSVLLALGVLLVPLNVAASVRVMTAGQHLSGLIIGIFTTAAISAGLYFATMLASGIMDRSLQGRHPQLFLGLSATQVALPLLERFPSWPLLAMLHILLLGLLAYGIVLFARDWLRSIFVERRKIAYYAAGTFVYAALVSFVHLTWGYSHPCDLPGGYYSPFLMVLCGLLFYLDAQLQRYTREHALLSRFNFAVYGLSILALALSADMPIARLVTLLIAVGLYGMVLWQYLTLPPLFLMLACLSWLYGMIVLQHVPNQWHMLASLPGLVGLFAAAYWLRTRQSSTLALGCYRMWMGATVLLTGWSLVHARPGMPAMGTALAAMALFFQGLRFAPGRLWFGGGKQTESAVNLLEGPWLYIVTVMGGVAVAYAPPWTVLPWAARSAFGLVLLAAVWTALGLRRYRSGPRVATAGMTVLFNSALLNVGLCLPLAVILGLPGVAVNRSLPLLLAAIGGVSLWLCLGLRFRMLFYVVLGTWGVAGLVFKLTYFPKSGTGGAMMALALAVWALLWWLEREPGEIRAMRREQVALAAMERQSLTLLWCATVPGNQTYEDALGRPLRETMVLLWIIGLVILGVRLVEAHLGWGWTLAAGLGALASMAVGGYFRLSASLAVAVSFGLGSWLTMVAGAVASSVAALSLAGTVYALLIWKLSVAILARPGLSRLAKTLHVGGEREASEQYVHVLALGVIVLGVGFPLWQYGLATANLILLLTIVVSSVFLWLAGQRYQQRIHSYALLGMGTLGGLVGYVSMAPTSLRDYRAPLRGLMEDRGVGMCLVLIALSMWAIAHGLSRRSREGEQLGDGFDQSLYRKPLRIVAAILSLLVAFRQMVLVWVDPLSATALIPMGALALASLCLLLANHSLGRRPLVLVGILFAVLAMLWLQAAWFHRGVGFTMLPVAGGISDRWLAMALVGLGLAIVAGRISRFPRWEQLYARPLRGAAMLTGGWALGCTLVMFAGAPLRADVFLPMSFLALILSLFPVLQSVSNAAIMRGIGIPLLGCALVVSTLASLGLGTWLQTAALIGGYALWGLENRVLPRFNRHRPQWAIELDIWPWLGLVAVLISLGYSGFGWNSRLAALSHIGYQVAGAVYLLLMLRNSDWAGFPWLAALLLTVAGLTFNVLWVDAFHARSLVDLAVPTLLAPLSVLMGNLVWTNLLLQVVPFWRKHGEILAARWSWRTRDLTTPFFVWPMMLFSWWLLQLVATLAYSMMTLHHGLLTVPWSSPVLVGCLLVLSFFHLWWLHRMAWEAHAVLLSLFATFWAGWLRIVTPFFHLSLFLALWSAALLLGHSLWQWRPWEGEGSRELRDTVSKWVAPSLILGTGALILVPNVPLSERLATLTVLFGIAAALGWQRQQVGWLVVALTMIVALLHGWPLLWVPLSAVNLLTPWFALQSALLAWLLLLSSDKLRRSLGNRAETHSQVAAPSEMHGSIGLVLSWAWPAMVMLALGEWALHGFFLVTMLAAIGQPQWLIGGGDPAAAILTALMLVLLGMRRVWQLRQDHQAGLGCGRSGRWEPFPDQALWICGMTALCGAVGVYVRLLWVGLAPANVWDTAALMGSTYVLFAIQRFTLSKPLMHVVLLLPLLALLTVPIQLASGHASATLMVAGLLYLLAARATDRTLPQYLALLAFNAALYLWIPGLANSSRMLQVYVAPATISVLILLHLHRKELKPTLLNGVRLAALSLLYASSTLDVFLRGELAVFAVVLALSLAGIVVGIALRTRAFLYNGVIFLVLNIFGQLIQLFPEQRFGKAIMLLALGVAITGGMIWFNLQRERILQRIRIFRADLETWA
ncbi:MAG TPA: hypothetical protein DEO88_01640, partial [Syntrophobacteraceae bacterium]|nr:hypothetical protein [Syntrophobacteraceae bacterium]